MSMPIRTILAAALVAATAALAGCLDWSQIEKAQFDAHELGQRVTAQRLAAEEALAQAPPDDPTRPGLETLHHRLATRERRMHAAAVELDALIAKARRIDATPEGQFLKELSDLLPPSVGVPLALGGALILSLSRGVQLRRAAKSIARGMEKAMQDDSVFRERFKANAVLFRSVQTPTARRLVDEATGKAKPPLGAAM